MSASSVTPAPSSAQRQKAEAFLAAHREPGCVLMPNVWDAGSARILEAAGFPFLLTTSAGVAFSLGRPDYTDAIEQRVPRAAAMGRALHARTDAFLAGRDDALAEAIRRGNRYLEAGADCVFVPGAADAETIGTLTREIAGPVSVVMGLRGNALTLAELAALGVRRVSVGGALSRMVYGVLWRAAEEMREHGTFGFAADQIGHAELNRLFVR